MLHCRSPVTRSGPTQHLLQATTWPALRPTRVSTLWRMSAMSLNKCHHLMQAQGEPIPTGGLAALADLSSAPYSIAQARPPLSSHYSSSYNGQYDGQRPIQGPPLQMAQGLTPNYPTVDYSQHWNPITSNGRSSSHVPPYDQDPSRYESTVTYMASSGTSVSNAAAEGSSIFPGLSPLAINLPAHGGNRTLPDPMSIHSSFDSGNGSMQGSDGDAGLYPQHLQTGTSQESVSSASQDAISATGQTCSTSSSPTGTQEMPAFGYVPMTQTSPSASSENASGFHSMDSSSTSNIGSYAASPTSGSNSQLPSLNSPYSDYRGRRGSQVPDRALGLEIGISTRNGNVYDPQGRPRILQPQPRRSPSYDLLKGSFEASGKRSVKMIKPNGHGRRPDGKR